MISTNWITFVIFSSLCQMVKARLFALFANFVFISSFGALSLDNRTDSPYLLNPIWWWWWWIHSQCTALLFFPLSHTTNTSIECPRCSHLNKENTIFEHLNEVSLKFMVSVPWIKIMACFFFVGFISGGTLCNLLNVCSHFL